MFASNRIFFQKTVILQSIYSFILAHSRKISLIFINLLVWLFYFTIYEMTSFVVNYVVIYRTFDWKYEDIVDASIFLTFELPLVLLHWFLFLFWWCLILLELLTHFQAFKHQPHKMFKCTQTIRRQFVDELLECFWCLKC